MGRKLETRERDTEWKSRKSYRNSTRKYVSLLGTDSECDRSPPLVRELLLQFRRLYTRLFRFSAPWPEVGSSVRDGPEITRPITDGEEIRFSAACELSQCFRHPLSFLREEHSSRDSLRVLRLHPVNQPPQQSHRDIPISAYWGRNKSPSPKSPSVRIIKGGNWD